MKASDLVVEALDHYVGGLDESGCSVTLLQGQFADGARRDDRRNVKSSRADYDLGEQTLNPNAEDLSGRCPWQGTA